MARFAGVLGQALLVAAPVVSGGCDFEGAGSNDDAATDGTGDDADAGETGTVTDIPALDDLPAPQLPPTLLDYGHDLPEHFQTAFVAGLDNTPSTNPVTNAGATLGRVLFWERRLSQNGSVACGSCHRPEAGFSDDVVQSEGFAGEHTRRNSMSLINLRWYGREAMFWDERAATLEDQVLMPIQNSAEMGLSLDQAVERIASADYYPALFEAAFGDPDITEERISMALAQFVRSIASYRSAWDEGVAEVAGDISLEFPNYSSQENRGKDIFFGQHDPDTRGLCGTCHLQANPLAFAPGGPGGPGGPGPGPDLSFDNTAIFFSVAPSNNGLLDDDDDGVGETTGLDQDQGKFKSPSLRNVALTGPYMHDGRFETLAEVVDHYNQGVEAHPNLDPALTDPQAGGGPIRLELGADDQDALVAFMETLSDASLATDPRWADPF